MLSTNQEEMSKEIRRILNRLIEIAQQFDINARLCPWNMYRRSIIEPIGNKEIKSMDSAKLSEYANLPIGATLARDQMCHRIGLNIKTEQEIHKFIDKWNAVKFNNQRENKAKGWIRVRRAEIQKYHRAFPVGFFQGSSKNRIYDEINEELPKLIGKKVEVSFQNIYQRGVTGQFWENAKAEAKKQGHEGSKEFRNRKFSLAPSALIVYVYR